MRKFVLFVACLPLFAVPFGIEQTQTFAEDEAETSEAIEESSVEEEEEAKNVVSYKIYHIEEDGSERVEDLHFKYGDVAFSTTEGEVGTEVLAVVQGNPTMDVKGQTVSLYRYLVKSVRFNGEVLEPVNYDKGEYSFFIVEGVNLFEVDFSGKAEISVVDLASMNWKSLFTVDNLLRLIVLAVLVLVSSGFFITLIKKGKIESITKEQFSQEAQKVVNSAVKSFLENDVKEMLEKQTLLSQEAVDVAQVLMRVTLLAQENTPEARLEIIRELQKYKATDKELAAQIQAIVDGAIKKRDEEQESRKEAIQEAKEAVEAIKPIESDESGDGYGKI